MESIRDILERNFDMRKIILYTVVAAMLTGVCSASENFNTEQAYTPANPLSPAKIQNTMAMKEGVITVPAGETFKCVFLSPVSSETAYTGQEINLALVNDFYYNNVLVAPAGSNVTGTVIEVSKAKHGSLNGKIAFRFTHILTPAGYDIPISAIIHNYDGTGTLVGGKDIGLFTSEVPASSESVGAKGYVPPYLGVRSGTSAAMTTAVETGGGSLLKSIWDKGNDVEISVNSRMELILTQPITITPIGAQNK